MSPEMWPVLAGGTLIAVALCWRWHSHRRVRARLVLALRSGDPAVRRAGIRVATDQGLRRNAKLLLVCVDREFDPEVLRFLAQSVLRNSWEPADQPALLRLRLWAHEQHAQPAKAPMRTAAPTLVRPGTSVALTQLAPQRPEPVRVVEETG